MGMITNQLLGAYSAVCSNPETCRTHKEASGNTEIYTVMVPEPLCNETCLHRDKLAERCDNMRMLAHQPAYTTEKGDIPRALYTALQSQKTVSAYFTSKQILPFGFAE